MNSIQEGTVVPQAVTTIMWGPPGWTPLFLLEVPPSPQLEQTARRLSAHIGRLVLWKSGLTKYSTLPWLSHESSSNIYSSCQLNLGLTTGLQLLERLQINLTMPRSTEVITDAACSNTQALWTPGHEFNTGRDSSTPGRYNNYVGSPRLNSPVLIGGTTVSPTRTDS